MAQDLKEEVKAIAFNLYNLSEKLFELSENGSGLSRDEIIKTISEATSTLVWIASRVPKDDSQGEIDDRS